MFSTSAASERGGHLCWDAEALTEHVILGLRAAHDQGLDPVRVGIDTWGVDFALLDGEGRLLGDMVAYRDSRTAGMDALLEGTLPFADMYRLCGIARQPFNTVYQMMAVLQEHPEYRREAKDFLLVPEYLSYCLTGRRAHEWTNISTTSLGDAQTRVFSREVIRAANLPESWFDTPIVQPGTRLGPLLPDIARRVGFDAEVILPATHDTGSAYMAVPARDEHAAFLSSGTWSLLGTELRAPVTDARALRSGFTNEGGYGGTIRFLKNIMGMWMLQCIHRETAGAHSFAEMADMAAASDYPCWVDAADNRFMAPDSMLEEVRAALREQGAPEPRSLADILRAVTVGLAVCYRDAIAGMREITGKTFTSVNIVGGGSQNVVLNQLPADLTGLPVYAGPTEGTALGNLAAQMLSDGAFASLADFRAALSASMDIVPYNPKKG